MTALDHHHLVSHNCRDSYQVGAAPLLLVGALASALMFMYAEKAHSATFEPTGYLLVQPRAGLSDKDMDRAMKIASARRMGRINNHNLQLVEMAGVASTDAVIKKLRASKLFKMVEEDARVVVAATTVSDPYYASSWHLPVINAPLAWDFNNGSGTVIAILDTGVDSTHPDLAPNIVPGWNVYDNNADTADVYGHGTAVAGTAAAAANDGIGSAGLAWGAKIMPIRISDTNGYAYFSTVAQGIYWAADHGARVVNVSFNGVAGSATVQAAADYLRAKGGVVVVAAGNSGAEEAIAPSASLLAVSATDRGDIKAGFTSTGAYVDLAAPGVGILTTTRGGGYGSASGTSFASPLVAGAAALAISANPALTADQVDAVILTTARDLGAAGYDTTFGSGLLNAGAIVTAALSQKVSAPIDAQAPSVAISSPLGGTVSGLVPVNVSASDNVGVASVDLYVNGKKIATDNAVPFSFSWNSSTFANGAVSVVAYAYDAAGNSKASAPVALTVSNIVADTVAPVVSLSTTTSGYGIRINASATDNVKVSSMSLAIDGKTVANVTGSSLVYGVRLRYFPAGTHTLTASATDTAGNKSSKSISINR
jgi:hypothetical protein